MGGFLTVTLANLIELRCRMVGEVGEEAVKMERDLLREGSEKEGEEVGLGSGEAWSEGGAKGIIGGVTRPEEGMQGKRGGNSTSESSASEAER